MVVGFFLLLLLFVAPGYLVLSRELGDEVRLSLSFAASVALYSASAVVFKVLGLPVSFVFLLVLPACLLLFHRRATFDFSGGFRVLVLAAVGLCVLASLVPIFPFDTDGIFQILSGRSFLGEDWMSAGFIDNYFQPVVFPQPLTYRPPLNSLNMGLAFSLLGYSYDVAKSYSLVFVVALSLVVFSVAKRLFDEKTALLSSVLLILLSPYPISLGLRVDVYNMAAYLILCFFLLWHLRGRWQYLAVLTGLLYLAHPMSVVFLVSMLSYWLFTERARVLRHVSWGGVFFVLLVFLVVSPWLIRNFLLFGNPLYNSSNAVLFSRDIEEYYRLSPPEVGDYMRYILNPVNFVLIKGGAVWKTLLPVPYSVAYHRVQPFEVINPVALYSTMAGVLGYPLFLLTIGLLFRRWREPIPFLFFAGFVLSMLVFGMRVSYTLSAIYPEVLLVGVLGLSVFKDDRRVLALIVLCAVLESCFVYIDLGRHEQDMAAMEWIMNNTKSTDLLMSRQHVMINYLTDRRTLPTPSEDWTGISETIRRYHVNYFAVHSEDLRLRKLDLRVLNQTLEYQVATREYVIYKVPD